MAIASAKSLNLASGRALPWVFHDDGSLDSRDCEELLRQFPGCSCVSRLESDRRAVTALADKPRIAQWRKVQVMVLKLVDVALWSQKPRALYVDSDVLFFQHPEEIFSLLSLSPGPNAFNRDVFSSYALPTYEIERGTGIKPRERLNAGLWVMNSKEIDLDLIEQWLGDPVFAPVLDEYVLDQTFLAMLASSSPHGVEYLPDAYDVSYRKDIVTAVCKHYVGVIRHGFELEGLRYLWEELYFARRWRRLIGPEG